MPSILQDVNKAKLFQNPFHSKNVAGQMNEARVCSYQTFIMRDQLPETAQPTAAAWLKVVTPSKDEALDAALDQGRSQLVAVVAAISQLSFRASAQPARFTGTSDRHCIQWVL